MYLLTLIIKQIQKSIFLISFGFIKCTKRLTQARASSRSATRFVAPATAFVAADDPLPNIA